MPQVVPHAYDCSKYKKCNLDLGYYVEHKCLENEQFDWQQGLCTRWFQCKAPNCVAGMRVPKPECGKAKQCRNGVWEHVRCKNGMAFVNGRCSQTISCVTLEATITNDRHKGKTRCSHGDTSPHQMYCSRFYICLYGEAVEMECLNGQKYNPKSKRCDPQYECPTNYQPTCYHGDTKPVDGVCDQYYSCVDGEFRLKFCPLGEVFRPEQRQCEYGECSGNSGGYDIEMEACKESPLPSGYRADPKDCGKFYQCAHGSWVPKTCPANLAFNPTIAVCDWPTNVAGCA